MVQNKIQDVNSQLKDAWQCDICSSKSGTGIEATFEVLPRLNEIKFGSGVIDELLFLDLPWECRFPSGIMMLEYAKDVLKSVYEQLRVVHEGQLSIIFAADLKGKQVISTIHNVIRVIEGAEEPDRFFILSNHQDAWTFGAVDPNSGTASLLEVVSRRVSFSDGGVSFYKQRLCVIHSPP